MSAKAKSGRELIEELLARPELLARFLDAEAKEDKAARFREALEHAERLRFTYKLDAFEDQLIGALQPAERQSLWNMPPELRARVSIDGHPLPIVTEDDIFPKREAASDKGGS